MPTWISKLSITSISSDFTVLPERPRLVVPNFKKRHDKELNWEIDNQYHRFNLAWIENHIYYQIDNLECSSPNVGVSMPKAPFGAGDVLL